MKKTTTLALLSALLLGGSSLFAQHNTEFERIWYGNPEAVEDGDFVFTAKNGVAQLDHNKFALTIENNSSDFLMYVPKESTFAYSFGDKHPNVKPYYIKPDDKKMKTLKADGGDQFRQEKFSFKLGGLYRIALDGNKVEAPEFQLPANKNSFTVGKFKVVLRKYDASTREAKAQFEVTYTGDDVAVINPANLSVTAEHRKTGDAVMYANDDKKSNATILHKGEKIKFNAVFHIEGRIVDMQFATMMIQWNDTFTETTADPVDVATIDFEMDAALTREKK